MTSTTAQLKDYVVTRRIVVGVVGFGVTLSVAVNQLDAHYVIDKGIAGWPPLGLLLALEILARAPWGSGRLKTTARVLATIAVAAGAGWLSYWHMVPAVEAHGESTSHNGAYIWPATVDGLMVIAAVAMVELGTRIRALKAQMVEVQAVPVEPVPVVESVIVEPIAPVVVEAEAIARQAAAQQAAPISPAAAVEQLLDEPYWTARLGPARRRTTKKA